MTLFEFLMALASVVIAIALTEMFAGWGRLLRAHITPRIDWLHLGWTLVVVLYSIQYWVGIWPYRDIVFDRIYQVWFLIFPTLFIVLVSYAITPDIEPDAKLDLRDYYMLRRGPIFFGLAAFLAMAQLADMVIFAEHIDLLSYSWWQLHQIGFGLIIVTLIQAMRTSITIHSLVMLVNLVFLISNGIGLYPGANGLIN